MKPKGLLDTVFPSEKFDQLRVTKNSTLAGLATMIFLQSLKNLTPEYQSLIDGLYLSTLSVSTTIAYLNIWNMLGREED